MRNRTALLLVLSLGILPLGCAENGATVAMRIVDEFQTALRTGDKQKCRSLVTEESAAALSGIPWHQVAAKQPLRVLGAEPRDSGYLVQVEDPNQDQRRSKFVVVREYGRIVVDLVASAGLTAESVERAAASGGESDFEPRELTPRDHDRIRQRQLAAPPR